MKTHRCKNSLKNQISIRYCGEYEFEQCNIDSQETWRMFNLMYDRDYFEPYMEYICKLNYCPFCGLELKE